ncbi:MAG: HAD hydrolase-like protein [candidate division Zixibacteria bacterium]|nr:HAD hydrolase-like protein [candidate division Zixibacteria bacterium]
MTVATFDLDHTLVKRRTPDTDTLKIMSINHSLEVLFGFKNIHYMKQIGPELYGMTDRSIMRQVLMNLGLTTSEIDSRIDELFAEIFSFFERNLRSHRNDEYIALPGTQMFLEKLRALGVRCGIATGNYRIFSRWKLDSVGLTEYFDFGGYGEDGDERSQIIKAALNRSGIKSDDIGCHFGDTKSDIESARANGMLAVAISVRAGGKFPSEDLAAAGPDLVLESYHDFDKVAELFSRYE